MSRHGRLAEEIYYYIRALTPPLGIEMGDQHGATAQDIRDDVHPESERTCVYPILNRLLRARKIRIAGFRGKHYLYVSREQPTE